MKPLALLATFLLTFGIIISLVPQNTTKNIKLTPEQLLQEVKTQAFFMNPDEVAEMIIKKDPSIQLVDVRSAKEFEKFSLPDAINIPLADILSEKYSDIFNQENKTIILYCNGSTQSTEAWFILRQTGYQNIYVLKGGVNYWAENIVNPSKPSDLKPDDEIAKYDLRKGMGTSLYGNNTTTVSNTNSDKGTKSEENKLKITPKKRKGASGGC